MNATHHCILSRDGTPIAFDVSGDGAPLILLHGLSACRRAWQDSGLRSALAAAGFRTIAIDQRGHGDSGRPTSAEQYQAGARLGDVEAVLDHLQLAQASLLGYSMGGVLALAAAAMRPARTTAVVAIGAHPFAEDLAPLRRVLDAGLVQWVSQVEAALGGLAPDTRQRLLGNDVAALRACVAADRSDFSAALARSGRPVLALIGEHDPRHACLAAFASHEAVQAVTLPGVDHVASLPAADHQLPTIIGFLRRASGIAAGKTPPPCRQTRTAG